MTQGPINADAQEKEPTGNVGANFSEITLALRHLGRGLQMEAVYQMEPVPGYSFHSKNTAEDILFMKLRQDPLSTEPSSFLRVCQHSGKKLPASHKKKKKKDAWKRISKGLKNSN